MTPVKNKDGTFQTMYAFKEFPANLWETVGKESYRMIGELKTGAGRIYAYRTIYRCLVDEDFIAEKENSGCLCLNCKDQGVVRDGDKTTYCTYCDLGGIAKKQFSDKYLDY